MKKALISRLVALRKKFEAEGYYADIKIRDHKPMLMFTISQLSDDDVEQIRKDCPEARHIAGS